MGFFRKLFGSDSGTEYQYNPTTYTTSVGSPNVTTDTTVSKEEAPAEAKQADTKEYDKSARRMKRKNGVSGSFGFTSKDAISGDGDSNQSVGS